MKRIILASSSPRRKELMEKLGLPFEIIVGDYEEDMTLKMPPAELAKFLSLGKAKSVAEKEKNAIVIGADTFIVFGGEVLGKPHTAEKAKERLRKLSGTQHEVITGFSIIDTDTGKEYSEAVTTKLFFREISEKEIEKYVATGEPLERAGAYAIQGGAALFLERLEGDYYNVIGLPILALSRALREFEVEI